MLLSSAASLSGPNPSSLLPSTRGLGWTPLPALQDACVHRQQHGVQRGGSPAAHRDPDGEIGHRPGYLAHGRAADADVAACRRGSTEPPEVRKGGKVPCFWAGWPRKSLLESGAEFFPWSRGQDPTRVGLEGMGPVMVVPTDVPPRAGRLRRRVTRLPS